MLFENWLFSAKSKSCTSLAHTAKRLKFTYRFNTGPVDHNLQHGLRNFRIAPTTNHKYVHIEDQCRRNTKRNQDVKSAMNPIIYL